MATKPKKRPVTPTSSATHDWREVFCRLLGETLNVAASAEGAGVSRDKCYAERRRNEAFAQSWDEAKATAIERLEAVAYERAQTISDTLLIFLLKSHKPAVYRERVETTSANYQINYAELTDDQLQRLANGEHPATVLSVRSDK